MAPLIGSPAHRVQFTLPANLARFTNMASAPTPTRITNRASRVFFAAKTAIESRRKVPVLLFDIVDTIVQDSFCEDLPAFFGKYFKDGRPFDLEGLKTCMRKGYCYIDGVEQLLHDVRETNYEMHAVTNYPIWYQMIEDRLLISKFLSRTFRSCKLGKMKPDLDLYSDVARHLEVDPSNCIFIDDRLRNVEDCIRSWDCGSALQECGSAATRFLSLGD